MDWENPVTLIVIPGLAGGLVIALLIVVLNRRGTAAGDAFAREPVRTDVINAARIRVAGVGGLGLVAMAVMVALNVPGVGKPLGVGALLGGALAAILIVWRRRSGPLPSSGETPGANAVLSIDHPRSSTDDTTNDGSIHSAVTAPPTIVGT